MRASGRIRTFHPHLSEVTALFTTGADLPQDVTNRKQNLVAALPNRTCRLVCGRNVVGENCTQFSAHCTVRTHMVRPAIGVRLAPRSLRRAPRLRAARATSRASPGIRVSRSGGCRTCLIHDGRTGEFAKTKPSGAVWLGRVRVGGHAGTTLRGAALLSRAGGAERCETVPPLHTAIFHALHGSPHVRRAEHHVLREGRGLYAQETIKSSLKQNNPLRTQSSSSSR